MPVINRFLLAAKALLQLDVYQMVAYGVYKFGLKTGHYQRVTVSPVSKSQPISLVLRPLFTFPDRASVLAVIGEEGRNRLLLEANEIVAGKVRLFGREPVDLKLSIDGELAHWTDYETGKTSLSSLNLPHNDIKFAWEPARFGWAFILGRAYHVSGDERFAQAFWRYSEEFLESNGPYLGPNWISGQEVALRLMAFVWAAQIFANSPHSTTERKLRLAQAVAWHAKRIPSTLVYARSQNNNHLISEAAGLYTAGLALPEHPHAKKWLQLGWKWLNHAFDEQIYPDGSYAQYSTNYHRLMLQLALWVWTLSNLSQGTTQKMEAELALAARWLAALLDESGGVPNLGANDGAYIFPLSVCPIEDFRPVVQAASLAFCGERLVKNGIWDEMSLWFGQKPTVISRLPMTKNDRPDFILRSTNSWGYLRAVKFYNRPSHADQFHLDLWWRGQNIAMDAGTYLYNAEAPWDNQLTSTLVHNTVTVNGAEQMTRAGRFLYLDWALAGIVGRWNKDNYQRAIARQHGYKKRFGIVHQRTVTAYSEDKWVVLDEMKHTRPILSPLKYRLHWLLPDWEWTIENRDEIKVIKLKSPQGWVMLAVTPGVADARISLVRAGELVHGEGQISPIMGWHSSTYAHKQPVLSFAIEVESKSTVTFTSEFTFSTAETESAATAANLLPAMMKDPHSKKHILLIHQAFATIGEPGGTRHHEFARYLAGLGHQVTVIASPVSYLTGSSSERQEEDEENITILRAYTYQALHKSFFHRVLAFFSFMFSSFFIGLRVKHVDLVWGTSPPIFQGWTAWLLARLKRVPFLFEVRDLWPQFAIAVGVLKNPTLIKMSRWLERFLYTHADRVMVNSPGYVEHVKGRGARTVDLVPNGADPEMFDPANDGKDFRAEHHLENKFVVLYAGAHGMSNDLGVVLDAARLVADVQEIQIVFLGDGKEKENLQAQAARMNLTNVKFLPPLPKSEMAQALAGSDACIAILKEIDEYKLTYPNKVFDYMAAGRPVALAIDGAIREVVETAGCGIFSLPGDAAALAVVIRTLAADPERSRNMGLAGRRYLEEHFSRTAIAEKLLEVLKKVIAGSIW